MVVYLLCHKHAIVWRVVPPVTRAWHWWVHASMWTHQPPQLSRCTCPATSRRKRPTWYMCGKGWRNPEISVIFFSIITGRLQNARNWNYLHVENFKPDLRLKSSTCRWFAIFFEWNFLHVDGFTLVLEWNLLHVDDFTCFSERKSSTCRRFQFFWISPPLTYSGQNL